MFNDLLKLVKSWSHREIVNGIVWVTSFPQGGQWSRWFSMTGIENSPIFTSIHLWTAVLSWELWKRQASVRHISVLSVGLYLLESDMHLTVINWIFAALVCKLKSSEFGKWRDVRMYDEIEKLDLKTALTLYLEGMSTPLLWAVVGCGLESSHCRSTCPLGSCLLAKLGLLEGDVHST